MPSWRFGTVVLTVVLLVVSSGKTFGDEGVDQYAKFPGTRYKFYLGAYGASVDSSVMLGTKGLGAGVFVDLEEALGLDTEIRVLLGGFEVALGERRRHLIQFDYTSFRRSGFKQLTEDIPIGDFILPIGSNVTTQFNMDIIRLKYEYALVQAKRVWVRLGAGAFIMPLSFETLFVAPGLEITNTVDESITAPLPVVGLQLNVALTPRLFLYQHLDILYLTIGNFQGNVLDAGLGLEYKINRHLGIVGGWNIFDLKIESEGDDYPPIDLFGKINFSFSGLYLGASVYW